MTDNTRTDVRVLGSLRSSAGRGVVRIEDRYDTDIDDLWSAVTQPERLARWWGRVEGDLRPGGEIRLFVTSAGLESVGRVEICEPPQRLRVISRETEESRAAGGPDAPPAFDSVTEVALTADGDHTILVIEVSGLPLDKVAFYGAGWQIHAENLAAYVTGRERGDEQARWGELVPSYQDLAAHLA
ncbi:uncharacterized protein YndB with AHSA1/START domain [Hamadaea flava]|uniref:SRPBCC domain-containing protein n=1 Tax=Hamadaea flava TaxID=1742688 RepID=A0ABV8LXH0_9ACTN|nr:SRPBCC domain-containing protein [Hamadaea flava]MCP2329375.1 uncharacterized protein YndB with AHSA1/START domain [Hamadaea flava]